MASRVHPFGEIPNFQPLFPRVPDSISRSSNFLRQKAYANGTAVRHISVSTLHTAPEITLRKAYNPVGGPLDTLVPPNILLIPAGRLPLVRNDDEKGNVAARFSIRKNRFGGQRVKSFRAARIETPDSPRIQAFNRERQTFPHIRLQKRRHFSVSRKTATDVPHNHHRPRRTF